MAHALVLPCTLSGSAFCTASGSTHSFQHRQKPEISRDMSSAFTHLTGTLMTSTTSEHSRMLEESHQTGIYLCLRLTCPVFTWGDLRHGFLSEAPKPPGSILCRCPCVCSSPGILTGCVGSPLLYVASAHLLGSVFLVTGVSPQLGLQLGQTGCVRGRHTRHCPFPVRDTLPKGLLVEESHIQSQPEDVHMHLCFH